VFKIKENKASSKEYWHLVYAVRTVRFGEGTETSPFPPSISDVTGQKDATLQTVAAFRPAWQRPEPTYLDCCASQICVAKRQLEVK